MTLQELQHQYTIDPQIIRIWIEQESETLLPVQETSIREYGILEGKDLLVSAPTSSGKTFLAEIAAIHTIYQRQKVIYLLPLKALAEEKYANFSEKYEDFGIDIVISTGDRTEFDEAIERGEFQLAVIVFEKAKRLLVKNKHVLNTCGLLVIDEVQMTADSSRGGDLEMLLTAILFTKEQQVKGVGLSPQIIALSAVIGDLNALDRWLGLDVLLSNVRPVELQEGILRKDGTFTSRGFISQDVSTTQFTPFPAHFTFNLKSVEGKREYQYKRLQHYVSYLLAENGQVLIFRKWKGLTRETALRLARDLQLPPALDALKAVQEMEDSLSKEMLLESLRHGVAFHNADLGRHERRVIEHYFKEDNSKIRVICATSTLAMGINLPVKTVIIHDLEKPDPDADVFQEIPLSSAEYKNMSGRAGRLKRQDEGQSILFADTPAEEGILWRNYIEGTFPCLNSLLAQSQFREECLFLLASGLCSSERELCEFMRRSYAGTLYWQEATEALQKMEGKIHQAVVYCESHGLLTKTEPELLRVTEIGRICAVQGVSVETFVMFMEFLPHLDQESCNAWEYLFLATHNRELEALYFRLSQSAYESGEYWRALRELQPRDYEPLTEHSERMLQDRFEVTKRIKMSLLLLDWIAGISLQHLEIKYSQFYRDKSYSGAIRSLTENVSWMLRLLADIAVVRHAEPERIVHLQRLSKMVLFGVSEGGIELAALHVPGFTRSMVMCLVEAGYTTEEQVLDAQIDELARIVPRDAAFRLQNRLYRKYSRTETRHLVDQKLRLEHLNHDTGLLKQVYSATTLEEFHEALLQIFQAPQIQFPLRENLETSQKRFGRDYLVERETGTVCLRILPPNIREVSDEQFGNLLTLGMKYTPAGFIVVGRPDFTEETLTRAEQFSRSYSKPLSLMPAYEICERYVQAIEGKADFLLE